MSGGAVRETEASAMDRPWRVVLTCCGRDAGVYLAATWEEADAFRNSFTSGEAVAEHGYSADATDWRHQRSGVIESLNDTSDSTPPALDAGGGAAFVEAVDAFARATRALERADISDPLLDVGIERVDTARARVLALHAAAVQAAVEQGRGEARLNMPEVVEGINRVAANLDASSMARLDAADAAGYARALAIAERCLDRAEVAAENFPQNERAGHYADGIARVIRALSVADDTPTTPALVNGGPPTDGLDDGR